MKKTRNRINKKNLLKWVDRFHSVPILVVGDIMLDRIIRGTVERISPEAPVPVLTVSEESLISAGGAGNVLANLAGLGAVPTLVSVRGGDASGVQLVHHMQSKGLSVDGLIIDTALPTTTKTRIMAGQQQIVRVDEEKKYGISPEVISQLIKTIEKEMSHHKGVIISDYGKGVVNQKLIKHTLRSAHEKKLFVTVDPKVEHFMQYKGVDAITPNTTEAVEGMRSIKPKNEKEFLVLGWKIMKRLKCQSLLLTRGDKGILLFTRKGEVKNIPTQAREVFDVTGAGDTVIAAFSLARAVGAPYEEAAHIANLAAGIVVGRLGTAVATQEDLIQAIRQARG